jgi:hypothetical protein
MLFTKNIQFSRLVKADGAMREFNFRRHSDSQGSMLFSVDVCDLRNNRIFFKMAQSEKTWKIIQTALPDWVTKNEQVFNELIQEELRNFS